MMTNARVPREAAFARYDWAPGRIEHARATLEANPKFLLSLPHPKRKGTLRDYVEYLLKNGETTCLTKACEFVERKQSKKK
jgi:hypothetical protein